MARCGDVLIAVAAIAATIAMQGCGLPAAIEVPCQDSLQGPMQRASMGALQKAETSCMNTFNAASQQSRCIANGAYFVKKAQDNALNGFVNTCGEFAQKQVCTKKDCSDITPAHLHEVIQTWVNNQFQLLVQQMITRVDEQVRSVVRQDYDNKFNSRQIPRVVRQQCRSFIVSRLTGQEMIQAQNRISSICASRISPNTQAFLNCQSAGVVQLGNARDQQVQSFTDRCARNTLDQACPIGSQCAIETNLIPLWQTDNQAQAYLNINWPSFQSSLQSAYMSRANSFVPNSFGPFKKLFELPDNLFPQSTFAMGAGFFAAMAMVIMGGVAFVVRMRRSQQREVLSRPESSELLSVEEQTTQAIVE